MIVKDADQIKEEDLQALIDNSVLEGKTIEYKQLLPGNSDSDKKEFLADVSSFANSSSGYIIYGIVEERDTGTPKELKGLDIKNVDQEIRRLESIIRHGIEPRIPSIYIRPIELSNSKTVLIIRISKSWTSPHRVSFKGHDKFYLRSSSGKYPLDVSELRTAFNLSETITERIRKFRETRISNIYANETPVPLYDNAKIILHLLPIISFASAQSYEIGRIARDPSRIRPINCSGWSHRYNLDGFLSYSTGREGKSHSYTQLFRNGIIEAAEALLLMPHGDELLIPSIAYEKELIESLTEYLSILKTINVELPIFIFLTLVDVKGYTMALDRRWLVRETYAIDRDVLMLPEVVIESYEIPPEEALRPCFDSIWNACGFSKSLNYDETGRWVRS